MIGQADSLWDNGEREESTTLYETALRLYRGHFLEEENHNAWVISCREQIKKLFITCVQRLGLFKEEKSTKKQSFGTGKALISILQKNSSTGTS